MMKKLINAGIIGLMVAMCAGCTSAGGNDGPARPRGSIDQAVGSGDEDIDEAVDSGSEDPDEERSERVEAADPAKVNHGHSITERVEPDPREISRSDKVLYTEDEAKEYLLDELSYPKGDSYTFELTDSSVKDRGAYLWYQYTVCYDGIPVQGADFTVITFNDGTIIEGYEGVFRVSISMPANIKTPEEVLKIYAQQYNDDRDFKYQTEHYLYFSKHQKCPYVYVYRYDCGKVLENITLTLDAETGEMLGYRPDAID